MKQVVLEKPGQLRLSEAPAPGAPGPGEALVRVHRVGVCGTDLHAFGGRQPYFTYPRIIGHELGVTVEAVGPGVSNITVGDRCAVEPALNCGRCVACRAGRGNCCVRLEVLGVHVDGGMRGMMLLPAAKLHPSAKLSLDQLALVETLAVGAHAVRRAAVAAGENVLVIGAGPIGLSIAAFALASGAKLIVMDLRPERLRFCREVLGIEHVLPADENALAMVSGITGGDLPTAVFDATGSGRSMSAAFEYVAHGGRLVFAGLFQGDVTFSDPHFHRREISLLASRNSTAEDFARVIWTVESGIVDPARWITHRCRLEETPERFPAWAGGSLECIKAVVEID